MENLEEEDYNLLAYSTYNCYYKGNLDNLEIWNNGNNKYYKDKKIELYDKEGNFYKTDYEREIKDIKKEIKLDKRNFGKTIFQIDYDFYLIPTLDSITRMNGREFLMSMLNKYGIKGFYGSYFRDIPMKVHYSYDRPKYDIDRPTEICCNYKDLYRHNLKSFTEFNYKKYIENYNKALEKYPNWKDELEIIKENNLNLICDFYMINRSTLQKDNFDRLTHAIRALNRKINNK